MKKEMLMAFEAYRKSRTAEEKLVDYARYLEEEKTCNSNECLAVYIGKNDFQTDPMTFLISHYDLHLLGDPLRLYFDYMEDEKMFVLFPVSDDEEANILLTREYYNAIRRATTEHLTGNFGQYMEIPQEFSAELKELGWEMGKTYRMPCFVSVEEIHGEIRMVMNYCLKGGYEIDWATAELPD